MTRILAVPQRDRTHRAHGACRSRRRTRSRRCDVVVKRVRGSNYEEAVQTLGNGDKPDAPEATPEELADYDAIIFGTPTRFGNISGQRRNFLDQTSCLWLHGALIGKVGSVFTSSAT